MAVGTADYSIKNLNEKTNAEIEGFLKKSKEELFNLRFQPPVSRLSRAISPACTPCFASVSLASARSRPLPNPRRSDYG